MVDTNDICDEEGHLTKLQAHVNKQTEARDNQGVQLKSGQAERLMSDLEAVTSGGKMDSLSQSLTTTQEEQREDLARTQILHQNDNAQHRSAEAERPCGKSRDIRIKKMEGPADTPNELAKKLTYFTYYELLYLEEDVQTDEIHDAYIKRTTEIRTRFRSGAYTQEWRLTEFLRALHEAHTVLTNSKLRTEYDSRLAAGDWDGTFQDLISKMPEIKEGGHWSGRIADEVSLKDLLLGGGFVSQSELAKFDRSDVDCAQPVKDGPELAQLLADGGLITFEELASVLLGKALIDRRQITLSQFNEAVANMRDHSHKLVDVLIDHGWLTPSEQLLIGLD